VLFAIFFIVFAAILIALGMRAKNRVFQSIIDSDLDEKLGDARLPGDEGLDMVQMVGLDQIDLRGIVLGGTGLSAYDIAKLHGGFHLLVDFRCQLCERVLPQWPEPCSHRTSQPPPLQGDNDVDQGYCEYCLENVCGPGCANPTRR
jgi:hypothetical protein